LFARAFCKSPRTASTGRPRSRISEFKCFTLDGITVLDISCGYANNIIECKKSI
jgi:hypothetical protein